MVWYRSTCGIIASDSLQQLFAKTPNVETLTIKYANLFDSWSDFLKAIVTLKRLRKLSITIIDIKKPNRCPFACLPSMNWNLAEMPPSSANMMLGLCPRLQNFQANPVSDSMSTINDEVLRVICEVMSTHQLVHV